MAPLKAILPRLREPAPAVTATVEVATAMATVEVAIAGRGAPKGTNRTADAVSDGFNA